MFNSLASQLSTKAASGGSILGYHKDTENTTTTSNAIPNVLDDELE